MHTKNILCLSEDRILPFKSAELSRVKVDIASLSQVRRPGNGKSVVGGAPTVLLLRHGQWHLSSECGCNHLQQGGLSHCRGWCSS